MLLHDVDSTKGATSQNDALYHNNGVSVHRHCTGHLFQVLVKVYLFKAILNSYIHEGNLLKVTSGVALERTSLASTS
jgi:hypothetical protein